LWPAGRIRLDQGDAVALLLQAQSSARPDDPRADDCDFFLSATAYHVVGKPDAAADVHSDVSVSSLCRLMSLARAAGGIRDSVLS
jgi:hypothetical protein